ncbi:penicillin-binding protein 1A [Acidicapsa acidisoli]|uniref:penicillin-binding protein 1A n=1 Tax=Acidicapsa acidisoli TaxID=1615681 RepID=UPI00295BFBD1|nr:PBP1A family penicillin-binding protein [Acidicapsa acidisoli]
MASTSPQQLPAKGGFRPPRLRSEKAPEQQRRKLTGRWTFAVLFSLAAIAGSLAGLTLVYSVDLPQIHDLERYRPSTTTELYDQKGRPFGSFALERRIIVNYEDFSPVLRQAVISIEDKNFASHWGINVFRVGGALWHDIVSHGRAQGASTLTMQLARNLFLSAERTTARKVQEAYLAIQIERSFTKEQIFTLYGNQIYLGHGMYGFEAASEFYFSKHASELNLTEAALLAGLPKGPVAYSPLLNPEKALRRRNLVLTEMENDRVITKQQADAARSAPLGLHIAQPEMSVAPWFVEEVRRELEKQFGAEEVHEAGLRVETTLDVDLQQVANHAVEDGVATYERRRGWKGVKQNLITQGIDTESYRHPDWVMKVKDGDYVHALVTSVLPLEIRARVGNMPIVMTPEDWKWTGQAHGDDLVKPGDVIYVQLAPGMEGTAHKATLEQDSGAEGSLMAIDNTSGDVLAMVGGRDYAVSQFNRATQSERQTGSSFKPYVYTTAIEDGVKPEDIIVDGPVSFGSYTPHNYEGDYKGAMTVLNAFAESRNIPALKLAARVGIHKVIDTAHRFGVTSNIPAYLPVALGAVEITLQEQVASYAVFPNDGVRVTPRLLKKVSNADGITLWEQAPSVTEVTSQQTARTMMRLLREVTRSGTGAAAAQLKHPLGGKTGTTSDYTDAWFLGFSPSVTCGVWVGFDSRESLGEKETGARAALPIWMTFMKAAIQGKDDERFLGDAAPVPSVAKTDAAQAAAVAPGKPAAKLAGASAPAVTPKPGQPSGVVKPTPPVSVGAKAIVVPPVKAVTPAAQGTPAKPVVRPAFQPSAGTGSLPKPTLQPKPALPQ